MFIEDFCAQSAPSFRLDSAATTITETPPLVPTGTCGQCGEDFQPRNSGGGSKQRFCSTKCRTAFHNSQRIKETLERVSETPQRISETLDTLGTQSAPSAKEDRFDWDDDEVVVIAEQRAVAVYTNDDDDVVIRQQGDGLYVEDTWLIVTRQNLAPLISRLKRLERGEAL